MESSLRKSFEVEANSLDEAKEKAIEEFVGYEFTEDGIDNRTIGTYGYIKDKEDLIHHKEEKFDNSFDNEKNIRI